MKRFVTIKKIKFLEKKMKPRKFARLLRRAEKLSKFVLASRMS